MESKSIPPAPGRSSQYHVVGGLSFLEAFKRGDLDACAGYLHPDAVWHPTPNMADHEAVQGRDAVRFTLEALRDRFETLNVEPEDGRQVGAHMLLISLMRGKSAFHSSDWSERACWVVTMRDELWGRIVVYPNPAAARVGFESLVETAKAGGDVLPAAATADRLQPGTGPYRGDRLAVDLEQSTASQSQPDNVAPAGAGTGVTLDLTFDEAEALARWLVKPTQDGASAIDDPGLRPAVMKLRSAVEREQAVRNVRRELEQAGIQTAHLSDQQVVQLGRRISAVAAPTVKPGEQPPQ